MSLNHSPNPLLWPVNAWRSAPLTITRAAQLVVKTIFLVVFICILVPPMALWDAGEHLVKLYRQLRST